MGEAIRGRRLTLAPRPSATGPATSAATEGSTGSRFSCLGSDFGSSDGEEAPVVGVKLALQVLGEDVGGTAWTPMVRRRRKTEAEIV